MITNQTLEESIYFFGAANENGYLSNFYLCKFSENGIEFNSVEQYFMYNKCLTFDKNNTKLIDRILNTVNPSYIKKLGREVKNFDEYQWEKVCYDIMRSGLKLKFKQNPALAEKLKSTKTANIYEASPFDRKWGIGYAIERAKGISPKSYGRNLLGLALMEVRAII